MKLNVILITGKTITIDVNSSDIIQTIKTKLQDITDIPVYEQILLFNGSQPDGYRLISDYYNLHDDSILYMCRINSSVSPSDTRITINIKYLIKNYIIYLQVDKLDKIQFVKKKIEQRIGIESDRLELFHKTVQLKNEYTIQFYNINNDATLELIYDYIKQ